MLSCHQYFSPVKYLQTPLQQKNHLILSLGVKRSIEAKLVIWWKCRLGHKTSVAKNIGPKSFGISWLSGSILKATKVFDSLRPS
jgi:hypothetical protein